MDAQKCEAFLTAFELGSMTAAAEQLGYSQSGITRMIGSLEDEVGFELLVRNKKGIRLTENGKAMLPLLRDIVRAHNDAKQMSADILGTVRGKLRIGSYYSISAMWMPSLLKEFTRKYPGVKIGLWEGGNREMAKWLADRSVDMCFCAEQSSGICDWIPLFNAEMVVWLPGGHPMSHAKAFPVERLEKEPFIHTQPGEDTELDRLISTLNLNPDLLFSTRDAYTTYNLVSAGLGISFNQRLISKNWSGNVVTLPFDPPQYVSLGIAVPSMKEASPAAKRFIENAVSVFGPQKS